MGKINLTKTFHQIFLKMTPRSFVVFGVFTFLVSWSEPGVCTHLRNPNFLCGTTYNMSTSTARENANASREVLLEGKRFHPMNEPKVVEVFIVVEKSLGDIFQQDRQQILDYLTAYFWDINLRFKTISGVQISFIVVEVQIISDSQKQPFIRAPAGSSVNIISYVDTLKSFISWVGNKANHQSNFDIAILMTALNDTKMDLLGLASNVKACQLNGSAAIFRDNGTWSSVTLAAHEIGHVLGAPHDDEPYVPSRCASRHDNIMATGGTNTLLQRWFFSECSSESISRYLKSPMGSCTSRMDSQGELPIAPGFSQVLAPSMTDKCKKMMNNSAAFVEKSNTDDCKVLKCVVLRNYNKGWTKKETFFSDLDNLECLGGGRCFRGRCRKAGALIMNVASRKCLYLNNKFESSGTLQMTTCPQSSKATPLDQFVIMNGSLGKMLATPFHSIGGTQNGDTCIHFQPKISKHVLTRHCDAFSKWQQWDLHPIGLGHGKQFWLLHVKTKRCAVAVGNVIKMKKCFWLDQRIRWTMMM